MDARLSHTRGGASAYREAGIPIARRRAGRKNNWQPDQKTCRLATAAERSIVLEAPTVSVNSLEDMPFGTGSRTLEGNKGAHDIYQRAKRHAVQRW